MLNTSHYKILKKLSKACKKIMLLSLIRIRI